MEEIDKRIEEILKENLLYGNPTSRQDCLDRIDDYVFLGHIKAAMKQLYEESRPKWISIKNRLPETHGTVLISRVDGHVMTMWYSKGVFIHNSSVGDIDRTDLVTHWQPMPLPYKE